ncbi:MAG: precorrin-2 C(20)-methyltransferase [Anaerovoracaceae bacterium]
MIGEFFAVGVGPGDPELLTIKAIKTMEKSDVIVLPKSGGSENIALKIAREYIENKEIVQCEMPMIKDLVKLDEFHDDSARIIGELLDQGKTVSFLTLGDPTIYSTVMYVHKRLTDNGYKTGIVSGIPSFCAVAASLNVSLCERDEMLHIIPATYQEAGGMDNLSGTKVLMKSGKNIMAIKDKLEDKNAMMVECATMENEKIYKDIKDLKEQSSYFSIIVIPSENRQN